MEKFKNEIQILFFVSLMILSVAQALEIYFLNILTDFKCRTNIIAKRNKTYGGTSLKPMYYETSRPTTTVIFAYIVDESRFEEIANPNGDDVRTQIAYDLGQKNHEMIVLGIKNCQNDEFDLISAFIFNIITPHPQYTTLNIEVMGEQNLSRIYSRNEFLVEQYQGNPNIYSGALQEHFNEVFPKMEYRSKRSDPSNIKEVRFYEILGGRRSTYPKEARWPVFVENGKYVPAGNFEANISEHNFLKRHKDQNVHLLIVDGKDYIRLISDNPLRPWLEEITKIADKMSRHNEILCIMGYFNFDWSEIDVASQIIMKHSEVQKHSKSKGYNVFTIGVGMFDTFYQNPNKKDSRHLSPTLNKKVTNFVEKHFGRATKEKTIEIYDFDASNVTMMGICSINGRYVPQEEFKNYRFTDQHRKAEFAFIVMNRSEMYDQNVFSVAQVNLYVGLLKTNNIVVFVIKTNNFKLYDLHIIPEWIDCHRGPVHPNQIAILGGGSFDTTFKFASPQYDVTYTLLRPDVANVLKEIRKALVHTTEGKGVIVANIDNIDTLNLGFWRFPIHTINGFYDPMVLSMSDMFYTEGGRKILFLIMKADKFKQMATAFSAMELTLITKLREEIATHYPVHQWIVFLVGLDNFGEKDFHLFAEFVKIHTNDVRSLHEFVYTFGDGIYQAAYEYRDTLPFTTANDMPMANTFNDFFCSIDIMLNLLNANK